MTLYFGNRFDITIVTLTKQEFYMNTSTAEFNKLHAEYEATILSDEDMKVDPVLMEGYEDKLEENAKALKARTDIEKSKDARKTFIVDLKTHAIFFGSFAATVFVGYKVSAIYDWLSAMI
ncbi:MAG: hypothetical protein C0490_15490 [Marivirga sp.]|nr:hypothetical protein [Marivirga sp.]